MDCTENNQRADVIRIAREWMNTPYHPHAKVKGQGADCAMYPLAVYQEAGMVPSDIVIPFYPPDWHMHRSEELYLEVVHEICRRTGGREIPFEEAGAADFMIFKIGRTYSHGAILINWPYAIHSYIPHGVGIFEADREARLHDRPRKFFTFWRKPE